MGTADQDDVEQDHYDAGHPRPDHDTSDQGAAVGDPK